MSPIRRLRLIFLRDRRRGGTLASGCFGSLCLVVGVPTAIHAGMSGASAPGAVWAGALASGAVFAILYGALGWLVIAYGALAFLRGTRRPRWADLLIFVVFLLG